MPDRDTPTPRITTEWSVHEGLAHGYSERLRAYAAASMSDVGRSRRLRDLSDACESYARAFVRWSSGDVPVEQKMRERRAFSLLAQAIDVELGP
jgi:hypothetical protein